MNIVYDGENPIPYGKTRIEKIWECEGLRCMVVMRYTGTRCGYVAVPSVHPLHGVPYSDDRLDDLHVAAICGLTFSGKLHDELNGDQDLWQFGYDCAHYGHNPDEQVIDRSGDRCFRSLDPFGHHVFLRECVHACEAMARELSRLEKKEKEKEQ